MRKVLLTTSTIFASCLLLGHGALAAVLPTHTGAASLMSTVALSDAAKSPAPLPSPPAAATMKPKKKAVPTPAPTIAPTPVPTTAPTPLATALPTATASDKPMHPSDTRPLAGNPSLSGQIDYTYDPKAVRSALSEIGVNHLPSRYRPTMVWTVAGVRFISIARENDPNATTITMTIVEDVDAMRAQSQVLSKSLMSRMVNPRMELKSAANKCKVNNTYRYSGVSIQHISCAQNSFGYAHIETAAVPNGDIPIIVTGTTGAHVFDEEPLKLIIRQINTDNSGG